MVSAKATSAGHTRSSTDWLDAHFQSARDEYEDAMRFVGIETDWRVLDAGCGSGGFLPLICQQVGLQGAVVALDLAPENIAHIDDLKRSGDVPANVQVRVGSLLAVPFQDATFDCVWSANVMQYLSDAECDQAIAEFKRVLKPGGTLAIKDFDDTCLLMLPMDASVIARFVLARRAKSDEAGVLGTSCGSTLPSRLRRAGLTDIRRKGWLVERWAPVGTATRGFLQAAIAHWTSVAEDFGVSAADLRTLREAATNPNALFDDPDFCWREGFVVAVGRVAK
jgi:SAM-dependent methyltransferase